MIKRSKFDLNAGKPLEAKLEADNAIRLATRNKRLFGKDLPLALHRRAMAHKALKAYEDGRNDFEHALATFSRADRIGYAILLRDFGLFLVNEMRHQTGNDVDGLRKIKAAERILRGNFPPDETKRAQLESVVTEGFVYRARLRTNRFDHVALDGLKQVDERLRELADTKPGYVLDNIVWILRYEMRVAEVNRYLPRAIALSIRLGNLKRTVTLSYMMGGGQVFRATLDRFF